MGIYLSGTVIGNTFLRQTLLDVICTLIIAKNTNIIDLFRTIFLAVYRYIDSIAAWELYSLIHITVGYIITDRNQLHITISSIFRK